MHFRIHMHMPAIPASAIACSVIVNQQYCRRSSFISVWEEVGLVTVHSNYWFRVFAITRKPHNYQH